MYPLISRTRFILKIAQELTCLIVCILELLLNEGLKVVIAGIGIWPEHIRFCNVTHTKSKKSVPALAFEHEVSLPATTREITSFNTWIFFLLDKNEWTQRTGVGYVHPGMHALIPRKTSICSLWSFRSPAGSSSVCKLHPMDAQRTSVSSSSTGPLLERAIKN